MNNYARLAAEYYDPLLHPTCANFDELSEAYLFPRLKKLFRPDTVVLEVGAGRSKVGEFLESTSFTFENLVLLDSSSEMLEHSKLWIGRGARGVVSDAQDTKLESGMFSLIVSSLGDPYNTQKFWHEVYRLLAVGGFCLFSTPASEWADEFRTGDARSSAEFICNDGTVVLVDSFVPPSEVQRSMFKAASLSLIDEAAYGVKDLHGVVSAKLKVREGIPVVRGYCVQKVSAT